MIKTSSSFIKYPLDKLFNLILQCGTFPTSWSNGIITVLHKSGNKDDPSNYRVDCEQSLFFFRFSGSNARARERRSRETRETRAAAREEKRETARLARANELSVGLTTQNTIG